MSGGGLASSARNSPAEGINSVFGTNLLGAGGVSNDWGTRQANNLTGYNVFNAGNNALDASKAAQGPASLTPLSPQSTIPMAPNGAFMPIQSQQGIFNQMAANSAGQLFNPGIQNPINGAKGPINQPMGPSPILGSLSRNGPNGLSRGYSKL